MYLFIYLSIIQAYLFYISLFHYLFIHLFYIHLPTSILFIYIHSYILFVYLFFSLFICSSIYLLIHDIQFELIPLHFFIFIFFFIFFIYFFLFLDIAIKQVRNQTIRNSATVTFNLITAFATKLFSRPGLKSIIIFIIITVN